jgi:pimeloyl-ACP methyl ester carboxylesterase
MSEAVSRRVSVHGLNLNAVDFGGAGRPDLLLLHGTGMHAWVWAPIAEALVDRFHVLALDHRGHGDSDKPDEDYVWTKFADDLTAAVDAMRLNRPMVVGHSMGGAVALIAEGRRPGLFSRALFIDPIVMEESYYEKLDPADNPLAVKTARRRSRWPSVEEAVALLSAKPPFDAWSERALELYVRHGTEGAPEGGVRLKCPPEIEARVFRDSHAFNPWPLVERFRAPVLLLGGKNDDRPAWKQIRRLSRTLPDARLIEFDDHGHFLPMENAALTVERIAEWFGAPGGTISNRPGDGEAPSCSPANR